MSRTSQKAFVRGDMVTCAHGVGAEHMKRREFIGLLRGAVALPLIARAQQTDPVRRVG